MSPHAFNPRAASPRVCMRCPWPPQHPVHAVTGAPRTGMVAQGDMVLSVEIGGGANLTLPNGERMSGVLYPR